MVKITVVYRDEYDCSYVIIAEGCDTEDALEKAIESAKEYVAKNGWFPGISPDEVVNRLKVVAVEEV